ncbi:malonyl-CoA-acyl carrier protein transacylase, mitochondrial [Ananas comosus]|uniref:Malonyl-CoA-acyl carrier protein transacylase, mitochondrial n=2 Tax=Ananas comosus TaxID=4615 RepID=A0A6P5GJ92_ANACO|nr:malonyl-CoA-acyl carrier protein transacylase, mitochondrial [Ananas comosus]
MSVSVGSEVSVSHDALFKDCKPTCAFLFPGQGAQTVGMGVEAQSVPAAAELYKKANDILGFDLLDVCTNGPKEKLDSTVISQPAIYVTSLAAVEVLRARDGGQEIIDSVDVTCGLSLGEYTALAFADAFSFEDGLKLVKLRGEAMQDAADAAGSAMVSVIGLDSEKVQLLCDAANEEVDEENKVQIANFLCPGNYAVSGGVKGIEAVEAKAKSFKARMTVRLAVAGAFHTSFMEPAVSRLEAALASTEIRTPKIPVISNVDAQAHSDPDTIKKILARQVTSPVQWELTVKTLLGKGLKKSYELGPGKVIAGILKRMDKGAAIENIGA